MRFEIDVNKNAELEIVVDQNSGSTLKGRGSGDILMETNTDGKFNIWGNLITNEGVYNFKNLGLIEKKIYNLNLKNINLLFKNMLHLFQFIREPLLEKYKLY